MKKKLYTIILLTSLIQPSVVLSEDKYENYNRTIEDFNTGLDKSLIKPVTEGYIATTPSPLRSAVYNFVNNLSEPITIINDLLQGKGEQGIQDSARFIFNSTFGLFGLIDIATPMGLEAHNEDFGQTFAAWGWADSDYFNLPLLGPSSVRDATGKPLSLMLTNYGIPFTLAKILSTREKIMPIDPIMDAAPDRYVFIRDAYMQQLNYLINDGKSNTTEKFKDFDFSN
jgi:phospholipid-binding lipoprotein MlaA